MNNRTDLIAKPGFSQRASDEELTPLAQSPALLQLRNRLVAENLKIRTFMEKNTDEHPYIKLIISLMWHNGLRISEVLKIRVGDILPGARIVIRGAKGSKNRVVSVAEDAIMWERNKLSIVSFIQSISRFYIYRICKKYGFYMKTEEDVNMKVTHYFRYLYILSLKLSSLNEEDISNVIGHKSVKSQRYYVEKTIKRN